MLDISGYPLKPQWATGATFFACQAAQQAVADIVFRQLEDDKSKVDVRKLSGTRCGFSPEDLENRRGLLWCFLR